MFSNEEEAIVTAIWIANRLVKDKEKSTRRKFYSIKDEWITRHQDRLVIGKVVRDESLVCRECGGSGHSPGGPCPRCYGTGTEGGSDDRYDPEAECSACDGKGRFPPGPCQRCGGTGKYRVSILYEHLFDIDGTHYTFHSYTKPAHLCDDPGADCEIYGGRFSQDQLDEMALPMSGILKILGYVARAQWSMQFDKYSGCYE